MKKAIFGIMAILTIFAMVSCGGGGGGTKSALADLTALTLDGQAVTLGTKITAAQWAAADTVDDLTVAQRATFTISRNKDGAAVVTTISSGAKVAFAKTYSAKPTTFGTGSTVDLEGGSFIVIQVTSENAATVNYYVVAVEITGTNTTLSSIQIADGPEASTVTGSRADTLEGLTALCDVNVTDRDKTNAEITLNFGSAFRGTAKIAKVSGTGTVTEADFTTDYSATTKPRITFADGDKLYVKLTAENEVNVMYYAYKVLIGWDASLKDIVFINEYKIGEQDVKEEMSVDTLGTPKDSLTGYPVADEGKIQFKITQPTTGFKVEGIANDPDATVTISTDGTTFVAGDDKIVFVEGNYLYVKVVSQNTQVTKYYKISIALKRVVNIPYGTVTGTIDANNPGSIWNTGATDWLYINRSNATEGTGWLDQDVADRSHGRAKLLWDENGIWVYAEVWEKVVSDHTGDHTVSSVELFINEAYPGDKSPGEYTTTSVTGTGDKNGGQYRMGANGEQTGSPTVGAVDNFIALGKADAKKFTNIDPPEGSINAIKSGYKVLFQAPWRFPDLYPIADDKTIAIELQINATGSDGTRVGVLNWNNISSNSYSSLLDYGEAVLKLNGATLGPQKPVITTQPKNTAVNTSTTATLTVEADTIDDGALSYEWYKATSASDVGTAVPGSNTDTLSVAASSTLGRTYYYVVVTSTLGGKTNTRTSNVVSVTVYDPDNPTVFTIDLSKVVTGDKPSWYPASGQGTFLSGTYTAGTGVTWAFTSTSDERGWIELAPDVIDELMSASSLKVSISGSLSDDPTPTGNSNFRIFFGNAKTGSNFNATNAIGSNDSNGTFTAITGADKVVTFTGNKSRDTLSYIGLLHQTAGPLTVTFSEIKVAIIYE